MKRSVVVTIVTVAVLAMAAGPVMAGAFRIPENGAAAMGQGNAFVGQADDPSAVHHNPAAITGLDGIQIMAGLTVITPEAEFEGVSAEKETFFPPYLFYANQIKDTDWFIGFGVNAPFGLGTEWDRDAPFNLYFRNAITPAGSVDVVTETTLEIDTVIAAIGQKADVSFLKDKEKLANLADTRWGTLEANEFTGQTAIPYIFTAGDFLTGPALVVDAVGGGRKAARAIHLYLTGQEVTVPENIQKGRLPDTELGDLEGIERKGRPPMPEIPVAERIDNFDEVDLVLTEEETLKETERCLQCGLTCFWRDDATRAKAGKDAA